jgi:hypothetical protein
MFNLKWKVIQLTLEKIDGTIKNGQSRDTDNIGYTRHGTKVTEN